MPIEAIQAMEKPLVELGAGVLDGLWALTQKLEENTTKMDGENDGRNTLFFNGMIFWGENPLFSETSISDWRDTIDITVALSADPRASSVSGV